MTRTTILVLCIFLRLLHHQRLIDAPYTMLILSVCVLVSKVEASVKTQMALVLPPPVVVGCCSMYFELP